MPKTEISQLPVLAYRGLRFFGRDLFVCLFWLGGECFLFVSGVLFVWLFSLLSFNTFVDVSFPNSTFLSYERQFM